MQIKTQAQVKSKLEIYYKINPQNKLLLNLCPTLKKGRYFPTFYLGAGLLQAIFGSKSQYKYDPNLKFTKQYINIPQYGEFCIDWAKGSQKQKEIKKKKLVIVFPGLVSSTNEPYIQNIMAKIYQQGYKVCLINDRIYTNRDIDKTIVLPENEYFSFVKDCRECVKYIKQQYPNYTFYAIGHSFGANTLAKYLGDYNQENPFVGAVCVSNPWDFYIGIRHLGRIADNYLVKSRQKVLKTHKEKFFDISQEKFDYQKIMNSKTCVELDNQFIVKAQGYKTVDDYYRNISSIHSIDRINIPVLFLQSKDDPILNYKTIPYDDVQHNKNLIMVVTNTGGHVGWFEGLFRPTRWYIKPTLEFLEAIDCLNEYNYNICTKN